MNFIRNRDIWGTFWLLAFSCPRQSIVALVDSLSLCDDWKYLEVVEKSDDNTFTCTGLREQQDVAWLWSGSLVATCPPPPASCTFSQAAFNTFFRISRASTTASNITVLATASPTLDYFGTTSLRCETAQESVTCPLDSGSQESVRVGSFSMSTEASTPSGYFSGTCHMTSYLPPDGRYSYTVLIMPGEVNVSAVFYGNNEIRRPKSIPHHNCPLYVKEDNSVSCVCFVNDLGSPPGQLKWNNMSSEQLILPGVKMDQHGVNYVCSLTWNRTVVQSVTYTLLVACAPRRNPADANYTTPTVEEGKPVTMELIAYPTSVNVTKYFLGPNEEPAREGVFLVVCNPSPPSSYKMLCTITVTKVTSDTAGFYKVMIINQAGNFSFAVHALPQNIAGLLFSYKAQQSVVSSHSVSVADGVGTSSALEDPLVNSVPGSVTTATSLDLQLAPGTSK
ncbi:uncharacterized protein LOC112567628 [Pomacea canaliculata]|uniref:uncharacterized protein LOC112567628 n=1 Tax=Pomacea canaliculata TaxID=400727 RepID=UPI000D7364F3|nr:uncharacterized protein LOC112567628 [Pomacea canaliculata]